MNELAPLTPSDMDQAIRLAKAMSTAKMLPKHLHEDVGTCLMIVEQAMRWGMSPFAVAQCTSNISGKLMFEGKLVAAAVEASGAIEGQFDYDYDGEGDDRKLTIAARRRGEAKDRQLTIKLKDVRTTNEHWKKQPDQMLAYSAARSWARRYTPAVLLGVYAPEEFDRDGKPQYEAPEYSGPTIEHKPEPEDAREAINDAAPMPAAAAATPRPPRKTEADPPTGRNLLVRDEIIAAYAAVTTRQDYLLTTDKYVPRMDWFRQHKPAIAEEIRKAMSAAWERTATVTDESQPDDDEIAPGLEIVGEANLASG